MIYSVSLSIDILDIAPSSVTGIGNGVNVG